MTESGWDLRLLAALLIAVIAYVGAWVWEEKRAAKKARAELEALNARLRGPDPAPRLRVLPGGES